MCLGSPACVCFWRSHHDGGRLLFCGFEFNNRGMLWSGLFGEIGHCGRLKVRTVYFKVDRSLKAVCG